MELMKSPGFTWHKWLFTPRRAAICKAERVWAFFPAQRTAQLQQTTLLLFLPLCLLCTD